MIYRRLYGVPSWGVRSPFQELERMKQVLDGYLGKETDLPLPGLSAGVFPAINLTEDKNNFYVRAELPGISKDDLEIEASGNNLSISGERKIPSLEEGARYHRRERESGKFSRMISLPSDIDSGKVNAVLTNGILKLTVPKAEKAKPRQISIK
ncbi:MAG: Hsp20/alpha crystallin family protein [Deltaproteobacteria bacterium]|jgi:HSP20 family protein